MSELKTQASNGDVQAFLAQAATPARLADCQQLLAMMQAATGQPPVLWGASIVGFGRYRYRYASGREGQWPLISFSPRKQDLALYLAPCAGLFEIHAALLARLGRYKTGKACLYIKQLTDIDSAVLQQLIGASVAAMAAERLD